MKANKTTETTSDPGTHKTRFGLHRADGKFSVLRLLGALTMTFVAGLILMGYLIARGTSMAPPPPVDLDGERVAALLHLRQLQGTGSEPAQEVDDLQMQILGHDVEEFRDGAATLPLTKSMSELPQVAPGALQDFGRGGLSAKFPFIWSYVMAGSFIVMGDTLADNPVVAFYNPYFDVVILTKWSLTD